MLLLEYVKFKNFMSYGNSFVTVDLKDYQLTAITGANANGKTTIMNAVVFALYNRSINRINKNNLINNINKRDLVVEIGFTKALHFYKVIRCVKPNSFEIYKDDKLITIDSRLDDYQKFLEDQILGMDFKTFIQTVTISMVNFTPFMELSNADRRIVVEDLLGIKVISAMNGVLKTKVSENNIKTNENSISLKMIKKELEQQRKAIDAIKEKNSVNRETLVKEKEDVLNSIEEHKKVIDVISKTIDDDSSLESQLLEENKKISDLRDRQNQIKVLIKGLNKDNKFLKENDNCPYCKQGIAKEYKENLISKIQNEKSGYELENKGILQSLNEKEKIVNDINEKLKESNAKRLNIAKEEGIIQGLKRHIEELDKRIIESSEQTLVENFKTEFNKSIMEAKKFSEEKKELMSLSVLYKEAEKILSDDGIKAVIIEQYLPLINQKVNHYLRELGFYLYFELDNQFNETLKAHGRENMSYSNLSEGEKRRLDMSILFTWRDIAQFRNCCSCQNIFIDEILDSSLDADGLESIIGLLKSFTDSRIMLITHRENVQDIGFDRVLAISKPKQFSIITEISH